MGLNPEPCASYALVDRFTCALCGETPKNVKAVFNTATQQIDVNISCCGKSHKASYSRQDLVSTKRLFEEDGDAVSN